MKLDPVLLNMACSWSIKAYKEKNKDAIKIESALTSTTAYVVKRKTIDIIVFRGTQQLGDWAFNLLPVPVPYAGRLCHGVCLKTITVKTYVKSKRCLVRYSSDWKTRPTNETRPRIAEHGL